MNIIKTNEYNKNQFKNDVQFVDHTIIENAVNCTVDSINQNGLYKKYSCFENNDTDYPWYHNNAGAGRYNQEFSIDNQEVLQMYLFDLMKKKDKNVIVEIGVNRNGYSISSTSIIIDNKRDNDIYFGIDIEDKSSLNDDNKKIFTICSPSQDFDVIFSKFNELGINEIDMLIIDGYHSINQCYLEWENYTKLLSCNGIVVMHDTNAHPGPYFLLKSINTDLYDVYKYFSDIVDWGIGVAVRK